jgi:hypothetical protein
MSDEAHKDLENSRPLGRPVGCLFFVLGGGIISAAAGAVVGSFVYCSKWPDSNLAGLVGMVHGFPIGLAVGCCLAALAYPFWRTVK